ncbi:MAG: uroporphyrinogen-III synthase, partial [Burkholderiaceae bacterium]
RTLAAAPGPGTARVLERLGIAPARIAEPPADAPQFDSDALWPVLAARRDWRGARVLVVRGDGGRDALGSQLRSCGAQVEHVAAYRRLAPAFDAAALTVLGAALSDPARHAWLFSSSQAVDHLAAARPQAGAGRALRTALATHPRIADRARAVGFQAVFESAPTLAAVVGCLQSIEPPIEP